MPNWCSNDLRIRGDKEVIKRFIENARSKDPKSSDEFAELSLQSLYPTPEELNKVTT